MVDKTLGVLGKCYILKCNMHKLLLIGIEDPAYSLVSQCIVVKSSDLIKLHTELSTASVSPMVSSVGIEVSKD